ncbi:MAG: tripartite tricarboxylate transporter substrate binding protein [Rhodospirillales bacterium]|nr:tripartite tricarboxylate transporter substrate binding protein [Rhodospirillales bacterium]
MGYKNKFKVAFAGAAMLAASSLAASAADFPTKDITHIMPWSAGGGTDTVMRTFLHYAEEPLGVAVRTINATGAQSGVGTFKLMNSRPDGYTIGTLTWDSMITVPYRKLVPGYDMDKLTYIANITLYPTVLAVGAKTPWKTLADFVKDAKANPGKFKVSNSGTSGIWHLHALDMCEKLGIEVNHIPFPKGSAPQREALLSGENEAASVSYATVSSAVESGQVRVLAVMSEKRDPSFPDVPTFKELGYDVIWGGMRILAVPADTPKAIQETLTAKLKMAFDNPEFQEKAKTTGMNAYWMDGPTSKAYVERTRVLANAMLDKLAAQGLLTK